MTLETRLWQWHCRLPGYRARHAVLEWLSRWPGAPKWPASLYYTFLPWRRVRHLESLTHRAARVPGVFVECGVARGGTALMLALRAKACHRDLWLFDTFEGLPAPTANDPDYDRAVLETGGCRGDLWDIRALMQRSGVDDRITYVKGLFQDTMPGASIPPIAVLHLDSDWYDSTMTCLTHLWPHVSPGGFVQFDDYGAWDGCRKAVDEFFGSSVQLHRVDNHAVWIQKPLPTRTPAGTSAWP